MDKPLAAHSETAGSQYLGKSLNLIDGDCAPRSKSLIEALAEAEVDKLKGGVYRSKMETAVDVADLARKYSVKLGMEAKYGAFSASADMGFSSEVKERTQTKIVMITKDLCSARLSIKSRRPNLTQEFRTDLNDARMSPQDLFNRYGTHITLGVAVGGSVTGIFSSRENTRQANEVLELAAKVSYCGVTGSTEYKKETTGFNQQLNINEQWIFKGGESQFRAALDQEKTAQNYQRWAESTDAQPGFYAFTEKIKPIWELDGISAARKTELETAFKYMFTRKSLENLERFVFTSEQPRKITTELLTVPQDYKILSGGAKSNWKEAAEKKGNMLTACYPLNLCNWTASHKDHHVSCASTLTLYALAVHDPFDLLDVEIELKESDHNVKVIEVTTDPISPGSGYVITGGGAKATYSGAGSILTGTFPALQGDAITTWTSRSMDHMRPCPAFLTTYAIKVKFRDESAPYRIETKVFPNASGPGSHNECKAGVGYGYRLAGGGALTCEHSGKVTQNFLTASFPEGDRWCAESKDHHVPRPAVLKAIAIGFKVVDRA